MLGGVASAEDVLQEAFLRYDAAVREAEAGSRAQIGSPKAYLSAVVTRLAIDELKSARARREAYVGAWLPEPVVTDGDGGGRGATTAELTSTDRAGDPRRMPKRPRRSPWRSCSSWTD